MLAVNIQLVIMKGMKSKMEKEKVRIKIEMEEPLYNHKVVTEVEEALYPDLGCDVIETLEKAINSFLKTYGYPNYDKDRVILTSVTDKEYEQLDDYLWDLRNNKKEEE